MSASFSRAALPVAARSLASGVQTLVQRFRPLWEAPLCYLLGRDIFFSYSRATAFGYARSLADAVETRVRETGPKRWTILGRRERRVSYFLDQLSSTPDRDLPATLERHLRRSSLLVLVATQQAVGSEYVRREVARFVSLGRPVVPIDVFDADSERDRLGVLRPLEGVEPWSTVAKAGLEREELVRIEQGQPSDAVVARIEKALTFRLQEDRLSAAVWGTVLTVFTLLTGATALSCGMILRANDETTQARNEAGELQRRAARASTSAQEATAMANVAKQQAARAADEARQHQDRADTARRDANRSEEIALARRLAAENNVSPEPGIETLDAALLKNIESTRLFPTVDAYRNLVNGLKVIPARVGIIDHNPRGPIDLKGQEVIRLVAFSPESDYLATVAGRRLRISRIDAQLPPRITGIAEFHVHDTASALQFSPSGAHLLLSEGNDLRLWETASFDELPPLKHASAIVNVAFSRDGSSMATAAGNVVQTWTFGPGPKKLGNFQHEHARRAAFSHDARILATLGGDTIRFWDANCPTDCKPVQAPVSLKSNLPYVNITFGPRGDYVFTEHLAPERYLSALSVSRQGDFGGLIDVFQVSPDGRYILRGNSYAGDGTNVSLSGLPQRPNGVSWTHHYRSSISHAVFSADSERVALSSPDGAITQVLDARSGLLVATVTHVEGNHPAGSNNPVAISNDGRYLARVRGFSAEVWEVSSNHRTQVVLDGEADEMNVAVGGGHIAFAGAGPRAIQILDASTGRELRVIVTPCDMPTLAISRKGTYVASAGDCGAFVWETASGQRVSQVESTGPPDAMAFSWDERHLLISGNGLRIREVKHPSLVRHFRDDNQGIEQKTSYTAVALSADGALLAAASGTEVVIRRVDTGEVVRHVRHPQRRATGNRLKIAFTAPHHLATADNDLIRMWDLSADVREVARFDFRSEDDNASFAMLSPDAHVVATVQAYGSRGGRLATDIGAVRLVRWLPEDIMASICERVSSTLTEDEWRLEFGQEPPRAQCPPPRPSRAR